MYGRSLWSGASLLLADIGGRCLKVPSGDVSSHGYTLCATVVVRSELVIGCVLSPSRHLGAVSASTQRWRVIARLHFVCHSRCTGRCTVGACDWVRPCSLKTRELWVWVRPCSVACHIVLWRQVRFIGSGKGLWVTVLFSISLLSSTQRCDVRPVRLADHRPVTRIVCVPVYGVSRCTVSVGVRS